MSERRDVHVHVERDDPAYRGERVYSDDPMAEESARAAGFFSAQLLWILVIALIIILIIAALGTGAVDLGGDNAAVDPTAAP